MRIKSQGEDVKGERWELRAKKEVAVAGAGGTKSQEPRTKSQERVNR